MNRRSHALARSSLFVLAFAIATATAGVAAAPPSPTPSAPASANGCAEPDSIGLVQALGYTIDDPRTLALIDFVERIPIGARRAVRKRAAVPEVETVADELERAPRNACASTDIDYRSKRMQYDVFKRWSAREALDIAPAIRLAITALRLGDAVTVPTRDATLAVFGTSTADLDARLAAAVLAPSPSPDVSPGCARDRRASVSYAEQPTYLHRSFSMHQSGQVTVSVSLDAHGYVRSATLFQADIPASSELVLAALLSAGTSNFRPEVRACQAVAGTYRFRVDFDTD